MSEKTEMEVTLEGNPAKPQGEAGAQMLERMNNSHDALTHWALAFLHHEKADTLLDIGCGGGATLHKLAARTTGKVYGIDYSSVSVIQSKAFNAQDVKSGKMEVLEASVAALPFADDLFGGITTVESFYFWEHPGEDLKEVYRVLKPAGTFLIIADIYEKPDLNETTRQNIKRFHLFNPTPAQFEALLTAAGFRDVKIHLKEGTDWICAEAKK